ncbi:MAG: DUF6683 family protein [Pyrinomonadaceae bacterium]
MFKFGIGFFVIALFFTIGTGIGNAQMYNPNQYSNPVIQKMYYNQMMTTKAIGGLIQGHMIKAGVNAANGKTGTRRSAQIKKDPLQFRPANVTVITDEQLAQMTKNAQEKQELENLFNSAISSYAETAGKDGFPYNDLAYAFNYFVVNNYHVYHDVLKSYKGYSNFGIIDISKLPNYVNLDGERTVYNQFRGVLSSNPSVAKLTDAEKEKFTALMAIMTNVPWTMYEAGIKSGNDEAIKGARQLAKQNLENLFGTSPENILINSSGVTVKGN